MCVLALTELFPDTNKKKENPVTSYIPLEMLADNLKEMRIKAVLGLYFVC